MPGTKLLRYASPRWGHDPTDGRSHLPISNSARMRSHQSRKWEVGLVITQIYYEMYTLCYNFSFSETNISYDAYNARFELMLSLIDSLSDVSGSSPAAIEKPLSRKNL